jgi:hypothetical protein
MINIKNRNTWETVFYDFLKWPSVGSKFIDFMLEFTFHFNVELGLTFVYREPRSYWVEHNRRCLCFLLYLFVYYFQLIFYIFIKKKGLFAVYGQSQQFLGYIVTAGFIREENTNPSVTSQTTIFKTLKKTKDRASRNPPITYVEPRCSGRVGSSCSTNEIRSITLVSNPLINHKWGKDREVHTSGTYPYSFVTQMFRYG